MKNIQSADEVCSAASSQQSGLLLLGHITSLNRLEQNGCPPPDMIAIDLDACYLEQLSHYEGDDLLNMLFGILNEQ